MSDTPIDERWWLAADGKWYPPTFRPGVEVVEVAAAGPPARPEPPMLPPTARATAEELAGLPADFHIVHGFGQGSRRYVVHHLVIGPTGVWVIIAANEPGTLVKQAGTLWNGDASISARIEEVEALTRFARKVLGVDVDSVLCFTRAELPRRAQMVGRVRVLELGALADHLGSGQRTLRPEQVAAALDRVDDWLRSAPTLPAGPASVSSRSMSVRRRIGAGTIVAAAVATGGSLGASFLTDVSVARTESARPSSTTVPTTIAPTGDLLTVDISCPRLGLGYQLIPRPVSTGLDLLQVAATVDDQHLFMGQLAAGMPGPPVMGVPPSTSVGFDYAVVGADDADGGVGESTHVDVVTPPWPC